MKRLHHIARTAAASAIAVLIGTSGAVVGSGPANASIPANTVHQIYFVMNATPGGSATIRYSSFLASVRNAVSNWVENRAGQVTQNTSALLRVTLESQARDVDLWINPRNLYVMGYSTETGETFAFPDQIDELRHLFRVTTNSSFPGINVNNVRALGFTGNYAQLDGAAQRARHQMSPGFYQVRGAIETLAHLTNPYTGNGGQQLAAARSLQQLIGFVSEGARFNDIEGAYRAGMNNSANNLSMMHVELENQWSLISSWIAGRSFGATNNLTIRLGNGNTRTLTDISHGRQYVRVALGS